MVVSTYEAGNVVVGVHSVPPYHNCFVTFTIPSHGIGNEKVTS